MKLSARSTPLRAYAVKLALVLGLAFLFLNGFAAASADGPVGPVAYLPQSNGFNTLAYDTHSHATVGNIPMSAGNYFGVAVNPAGTRAYVSNDYGNDLVVIDTSTNQQVADIDLPAPGYGGCHPRGVIVSNDSSHVYVACEESNTVYEIDAQTNTLSKTIVIGSPNGLAISPDGLVLYVGSDYNYTLRIVDLTDTNFSQRILQTSYPDEIVLNPRDGLIYMGHAPYDNITIINPASTVMYPNGRVVGNLIVDQIRDMEFSPDGSTLYVTRQPSDVNHGEIISFDTTQVIPNPQDPVDYNISGTINVPLSPTVLNMDTSGSCLIVQHPDAFGMFEVDMHTLQIAREYSVGGGLGTHGRFLTPTPASQWVEFKDTGYDVNDNSGAAHLTVRRGCNSTGAVTVHYATADNTAEAGVEYQATSGDLTFAAGELSKTIDVPILDDNAYHGTLSFNVTLSNPNGATLGDPTTVRVNIHETSPSADIYVQGLAAPNPVTSGGQITYCYGVGNSGPDAATNITLTDTVAAGTTFASATIMDCDSGGSGNSSLRTAPSGRVSGNAFPALTPGCTAPNVGATGNIVCTWDSLNRFDKVTVQIVLNVTAPYGTVSNTATATSGVAEPYPSNNSQTLDVNVASDVYVSADGNCGANVPCYSTIGDGISHVTNGKTVHVSAGTYNEDVSMGRNATVQLNGDVTITGALSVYNGTFVSTPATLTVQGYLYQGSANNFDSHNGTVELGADGSQSLYSDFTFHNLKIKAGTTVETGTYLLNVDGTLTNNGVINHSVYSQYVSTTPIPFVDGVNKTSVLLTANGGTDLEYTNVSTTMGQTPPACDTNDFPVTAVKRYYDISPTVDAGATIRFYYAPSEANGLNAADVQVYHCDGSTWQPLAGPYTRGTQDGMNYIEVAYGSSFSPFALGSSGTVSTSTPTETASRTPTVTPSVTNTPTDIGTATATTTPSVTPTITNTPSQTPTMTPTSTSTKTPTMTATSTSTKTPTMTPTVSNTPTSTPTFTATIDPCAAPLSTPTLLTPANKATVKIQVKFDWSDVVCGTRYELMVRLKTKKGAVVINQTNLTASSYSKKLAANSAYVWQVRACSANACSAWSAWQKFKTKK